MEFREAVITALDKVLASGVVEKTIEDSLQKTIASIIHGELRDFSKFGEALKKKIEESLALYGELDLPSYNETLLKYVRLNLKNIMENSAQKLIADKMQGLLTPAPASIKVSELIDQYRKYLREKNNRSEEEAEFNPLRFTFGWKVDYGHCHFYISEKPKVEPSFCDIRFTAARDGEIYAVYFSTKDVEKQLFAGPLFEFERSLFQMRAAGTILEMDIGEDDVDKSY
jgi:hypothetical protein